MRQINSQGEPSALTQWRAGSQNDVNFGYDLVPAEVRTIVKDALIAEQRGLCAYTGIGINSARSHIEHLLPQAHCQRGQDVEYANMAACYPAPGEVYVPFGALLKANWPSSAERHLFVSPRSPGCEARFTFDIRGRISVAENDAAPGETVKRLGLNDERLGDLRKEAISATLEWRGRHPAMLDLPSARRRLARLESAEAETSRLEPFCFVLKQALRKHIRRLESIRESKRNRSR